MNDEPEMKPAPSLYLMTALILQNITFTDDPEKTRQNNARRTVNALLDEAWDCGFRDVVELQRIGMLHAWSLRDGSPWTDDLKDLCRRALESVEPDAIRRVLTQTGSAGILGTLDLSNGEITAS